MHLEEASQSQVLYLFHKLHLMIMNHRVQSTCMWGVGVCLGWCFHCLFTAVRAIDDPLSAFEKILREKDKERERIRRRKRSFSRSLSPRPRSRASRSRSPPLHHRKR